MKEFTDEDHGHVHIHYEWRRGSADDRLYKAAEGTPYLFSSSKIKKKSSLFLLLRDSGHSPLSLKD